MKTARLFYVPNRARNARKATVEAHPDRLVEDLDAWQRELATNTNDNPEDVTVAVVLDGNYVAHVGPLTGYRKAALRRAGVSFPGAPATHLMKRTDNPDEQ